MKTYAISNGDWIKIGKAADPWVRLRQLQTGNAQKLELVAIFDGDIESKTHDAFDQRHDRGEGEWFQDSWILREHLWLLGFYPISKWERGNADNRSHLAGFDAGFRAGLVHFRDAISTFNEGVEEHW